MRRNLVPGKIGIDFLDGYIFSEMNDLLMSEGMDASGLYRYYTMRLDGRLGGILEYEHDLANYVIEHCQGRRIVEIGAGLGELPIILALNGMKSAGVEFNEGRQRAGRRVRERAVNCFPEVGEHYEFIAGGYPEALVDTAWTGPDVTLLFTNVIASWDRARTEAIDAFFPQVGEVILELRMFGVLRDEEAARQQLFDEIARYAKSAERLPELSPAMHFARFTF